MWGAISRLFHKNGKSKSLDDESDGAIMDKGDQRRFKDREIETYESRLVSNVLTFYPISFLIYLFLEFLPELIYRRCLRLYSVERVVYHWFIQWGIPCNCHLIEPSCLVSNRLSEKCAFFLISIIF